MRQRLRRLTAALRQADRTADMAAELEERVKRLSATVAENERDLRRMAPQVAALEVRLNAVETQAQQPGYDATDDERRQAVALVEEVKAEHARVRARISAAVVFEERIRVLEESAGITSP